MINQLNGCSKPASYIESLCDVVPNKRRNETDFKLLLDCLEKMHKECIPFKKKILQHLNIHAIENHNLDLKLAGICFAKATLLYRKSTNKDEGPVGAWKSGFLAELINIETNLNQMYTLVGVTSNKILENINEDEYNDIDSSDKPSEQKSSYESVVNRHLRKINISVHNICCLISIKTDFDLPIPLVILLRLALKLCLLRLKDYKKKPNSIMKEYIYSFTPQFIGLGLMMFNCLFATLRSRIIPYTTFINQTIVNMFEWSRASNLIHHNEGAYHSIRSHLFNSISSFLTQFSLNLNFDPLTLDKLIKVEIVENLEAMLKATSNEPLLSEAHQVDALKCLENLFVTYHNFLNSQMESTVKGYIIETCINIYRDFDSNTVNLPQRRQLLKLLQIIASQPYATSATEIAYNIFESAEKKETDATIKVIICHSLKIGLAHRPTIVSHYDVYNIYGRPISLSTSEVEPKPIESIELASECTAEVEMDLAHEPPTENIVEPVAEDEAEPDPIIAYESTQTPQKDPPTTKTTSELTPSAPTPEPLMENQEIDGSPTSTNHLNHNGYEKNEVVGVELPEDAENMVESYMNDFVNKLA